MHNVKLKVCFTEHLNILEIFLGSKGHFTPWRWFPPELGLTVEFVLSQQLYTTVSQTSPLCIFENPPEFIF